MVYIRYCVMVSIPIGFSSSLQPWSAVKGRLSSLGFNPYRVFKFVATSVSIEHQALAAPVSIPIGFSSSLQLGLAWRRSTPTKGVSIPIGFSSSLQHMEEVADMYVSKQFQSLSGFQVRCNFGSGSRNWPREQVSIPIGFSSSLQRPLNHMKIEGSI